MGLDDKIVIGLAGRYPVAHKDLLEVAAEKVLDDVKLQLHNGTIISIDANNGQQEEPEPAD